MELLQSFAKLTVYIMEIPIPGKKVFILKKAPDLSIAFPSQKPGILPHGRLQAGWSVNIGTVPTGSGGSGRCVPYGCEPLHHYTPTRHIFRGKKIVDGIYVDLVRWVLNISL